MKIQLQSTFLQAVFLVGALTTLLTSVQAKTPILIIPGLTGSQLWGTVSGDGLCDSASPRLLWLGWRSLICTSTLELRFNAATGRYSDKSGVSVSVPGFGDTNTVECLDNNQFICNTVREVGYFKEFVKYFTDRGYQRRFNLRAAPYDWRLAADSLARRGYFNNLRALIETMYRQTGQPVAMVVHSMGGPVSLYFLNEMVTQEWKNKYIKVYIPLSGAWAGASASLEALVSGILPFPLGMNPIALRGLERSLPSVYWLAPRAEIYQNQVLVQTLIPNASYTANDYQQLFTNVAKYPLGWTKYMPTTSINAGYPYPQVPTYCFYGSNIQTPLTYIYSSDDPSSSPYFINGLGDGVVNNISLEVCLKWAASTNSSGFQSRAFPGVNHGDMVRNTRVLESICNIVDPLSGCATVATATDSATTAGSISILCLLAIAFMSVMMV